jgi:hypothetical protein
MAFKGKIYISGPRMGTSNLVKGTEIFFKKSKKKIKRKKKNGKK